MQRGLAIGLLVAAVAVCIVILRDPNRRGAATPHPESAEASQPTPPDAVALRFEARFVYTAGDPIAGVAFFPVASRE